LGVTEVHTSPDFLQRKVVPIGGLSEAIEVQVAAPIQIVMANLDHALEPSHSLVVDLVAPEQIGVIAEIAQEPAELPQCLGGAIDAGGKTARGKLSGFFHRKK
jgi:hypothetical protein